MTNRRYSVPQQPHHNYNYPPPSPTLAESQSSIYVMVNTDEVPRKLEDFVDIFSVFDSIRHIVGYCLPLKSYVECFGNAEACRVIKAIEDVEMYQQHMQRFKFLIAPLNTVPVNELEFNAMINSAQNPLEPTSGNVCHNRFFMRPVITRPPLEVMRSVDWSATHFVMDKFKLNLNPHLIPIRLPDGLECYIRLNLADHCQESYNDGQEASEFGFYHFREVQRDCSGYPSLPHPPPPFLQGRKRIRSMNNNWSSSSQSLVR